MPRGEMFRYIVLPMIAFAIAGVILSLTVLGPKEDQSPNCSEQVSAGTPC